MLNQQTGRVEITTQNHGFAVGIDTLPADLEPTHINLNDRTLEGMRHRGCRSSACSTTPKRRPGRTTAPILFEEFRKLME